MAYESEYPPFYVTVDIVVLAIRDSRLHALMIRRASEPYTGAWALPGGFVEIDEDLRDAAERELEEETGVRIGTETLTQVHTYGTPGRDPRHRVVSVAWLAAFPETVDVTAGDDASHAEWRPVDDLLVDDSGERLAFDHAGILRDAVETARERLVNAEPPLLAAGFTGDGEFSLSQLRAVYEAVLGHALDAGNFQRKVKTTQQIVEATGRREPAPGGRGRPAEMFRLRS